MIDLDVCRKCPCFKVPGCFECTFLKVRRVGVVVNICTGHYPHGCTEDDCMAAKEAAKRERA
ncbi:MAG: hypothetical protein ACYC9Q_14900 [Bacillota bacterium]